MNHYGYITDNSYELSYTAITWDFVRYNEDQSTTAYTGIESTVTIESDKVVMFDTPTAFNNWRYEFQLEEDI
jgi:hypothetical protein